MKANLIYAGRGERLLAYLIDALLIIVILRIIAGMFITIDTNGNIAVNPVFYLVMFLVNLAYYTIFTASRWQATPGKRLLGIYVVRTDNRMLNYTSALERFLAFTLPFMPVYVSFIPAQLAQLATMVMIGYWFMPILYTPERVGLHDRLCHTRVLIGKVG